MTVEQKRQELLKRVLEVQMWSPEAEDVEVVQDCDADFYPDVDSFLSFL